MPMQKTSPAAISSPAAAGESAALRRWLTIAAIAALALAGAAAGCKEIWDTDVFWHLACGDWMLQNGRILGTDPFSIDPEPRWINVHWLFQVIVSCLHASGGFEMVTVMKMALAASTLLALALALRRRVPVAWLVFAGLAALHLMAGRLRERPESFTLLLLTITIVLVEDVRQGGAPRRLWWLCPLMVVWVNMHGLYFLGLAIMWSAMLGALADKALKRQGLWGQLPTQQALAPMAAASIACLLNPWHIDAVLQPLLLWTRVSGQADYTYVVSELQPTWQCLPRYKDVILLAALTIVIVAVNFRRIPLAHAVWIAAFGLLASLALRNLGLLGPVFGYLLAWHGGGLLNRIHGPWARRFAPVAAVTMILVAMAYTACCATELTYRAERNDRRFGLGVQDNVFPIESAKFIRDLRAGDGPVPGGILCENFGDASTFIYYCSPTHLLYMDGRLEAHSRERFVEQNRIRQALRTRQGADKIKLPAGVRFVVARFDSREQIGALSSSDRFRLIHVDPVAAVFAWDGWVAGAGASPGRLPASNISDFDRPLSKDGLVAGASVEPRRWWRQNPQSRNYRLGSFLLTLGMVEPASGILASRPEKMRMVLTGSRYLVAARQEPNPPTDSAAAGKALAHQQLSLQACLPPQAVPVDIDIAQALRLYAGMDPRLAGEADHEDFSLNHVLAMVQSHQYDAAEKTLGAFLDNLPVNMRNNPPRNFLSTRDTLNARLDESRARLMKMKWQDLPLEKRVEALASREIGLTDQAIEELQAARQLPGDLRLLLGDLLLQRGQTAQARQAYAAAAGPANQSEIPLRLALCDWADGEYFTAAEKLAALAQSGDSPLVRFYQALLLEQIGDYEAARAAVTEAQFPANEPLAQATEQLRLRLTLYR